MYYINMGDDLTVNCGEYVKILALDIATTTGYALGKNNKIKYGHFVLPAAPSNGERFLAFSMWLSGLIDAERPDYISIERPFVRGAGTFYLFGLCATAELVCASYGLPVSKFANSTIKKFLTGSGKASKIQMIDEVKRKGYPVVTDDEADAIALHLYTQSLIHYHMEEEEE